MAITGKWGYTDDGDTITITVPKMDYKSNFSLLVDDPGNVELTNVTTPLDQPEVLRYSLDNVSNIYAGTSIDPAFFATSKLGKSLLMKNEEIYRVTNSGETDGLMPTSVDLPIWYHTVIRTPVSEYLTAKTLYDGLCRHIAMMVKEVADGSLLNMLLRGSLNPQG